MTEDTRPPWHFEQPKGAAVLLSPSEYVALQREAYRAGLRAAAMHIAELENQLTHERDENVKMLRIAADECDQLRAQVRQTKEIGL